MSSNNYSLANPLSLVLDKKPEDFKREDFLKVIQKQNMERITFHYTALDGRLKELRIPLFSPEQAERIMIEGERVDGSSLFKGIVDPQLSDLYIVPDYKTAFINPFNEKSLDFICRCLTKEGERAQFAPDNILRKAHRLFIQQTGLELFAGGELEFYLISDPGRNIFPIEEQKGYHESSPFMKSGEMLDEMVTLLTRITQAVKYAHSEAGAISNIESELDEINQKRADQLEIEFFPGAVEETADFLVLSKWLIRNVAYQYGCIATFVPKIKQSVAGNGLHFHLELKKDGKNLMKGEDKKLSEQALRLIGGLCNYGDCLTALGNTVASSYFRLVPNQEAPTKIYWSDLDRSALVRVPLAWSEKHDLASKINPGGESISNISPTGQTVEFRSPDGSAWIHLLLGGVLMSTHWAFQDDSSLEVVQKYYYVSSGAKSNHTLNSFPDLPKNCVQSSELLARKREFLEKEGVFPSRVVDYVINKLKEEEVIVVDHDRQRSLQKLMHKDLHKC